jgi:hypothetical protein
MRVTRLVDGTLERTNMLGNEVGERKEVTISGRGTPGFDFMPACK